MRTAISSHGFLVRLVLHRILFKHKYVCLRLDACDGSPASNLPNPLSIFPYTKHTHTLMQENVAKAPTDSKTS